MKEYQHQRRCMGQRHACEKLRTVARRVKVRDGVVWGRDMRVRS